MKLIVHGLGRMGLQIARKLSESGHEVIALNRSPEPTAKAVSYGAAAATNMKEAIGFFKTNEQIIVWLMLPNEVTNEIAYEWLKLLPDHSVIINGANSDYKETQKLNEVLSNANKKLVDVGVSGGVWGYQNGFPLMVGSDDKQAVESLTPIFESLTQPGGAWAYFGASGAGNYVKMVHNAIEYGVMQSLAEGYRLLKEGPYENLNLGEAGDVWQHHSVISSWLNELTVQAVTENPDMDGLTGYIAESGEARWALRTAKEQGFDIPAIKAAFDVRLKSQQDETNYATKIVAAQRNKFGGHNLNGEGAE